ncbi:MAG: GGDEF domain-containing protein [Eubacteriales bacterium]|nr:GGDEF domain-containing protein [Eubacteriales bacterium]
MKNYEQDLRYDVLSVLQIVAMFVAVLGTFSDIVNQRPLSVVLEPVMALLVLMGIWFYQKKNQKRRYIAKLICMTFFCWIYLPLSWYYSPGISSAIGYYAILIIILAVFFVEYKFEFVFPVVAIGISMFMIRYELINPAHFVPFPNKEIQINDITINFLIVVVLFSLIITFINRHYVHEKIRLYRASITDELTGVYNRRHLLKCLEDMVKENRGKKNISLLFIDINQFKWINDTYGHIEGDVVLKKLGDIMKLCFPISGRFGGDEFVVIIPDTDFPEAEMQAEKLKKEFEEYVQTQNYTQLSLSIGIFSSKEHNAQEIIRKADEFMYNIKHASR